LKSNFLEVPTYQVHALPSSNAVILLNPSSFMAVAFVDLKV